MGSDWEEAINQGDIGSVRLLLDQGADVDSRDTHGQTAIMRASRMGQRDLVKLLADYGAELDAAAKFNLSALMLAVINGHTDIVQNLVKPARTWASGAARPFRVSTERPPSLWPMMLEELRSLSC